LNVPTHRFADLVNFGEVSWGVLFLPETKFP
jgi:hypothetical protein